MSDAPQRTRPARTHRGLATRAGASETASPTRIGPYVLLRPLARGGMGDVWFARHVGPAGYERDVALKRIHPHLVGDAHTTEMFLREARAGSHLNHPNSVPVIDLNVQDGVPYLVMELVDGVDLRRLASRGEILGEPISQALAGYVIHQVLWALEAAHGLLDDEGVPAPLVHRDISPENILVGRYGEVRVTDFGLAKQLQASDQLTRAGEVKGKYCYMAPEQLAGEALDGRADLFAVGVTFYELLCGCRPYEAASPTEAWERCRAPIAHPRARRPELNIALAELAHRWCQPEPERRGRDVASARRELSAVLELICTGMPNVQLAEWALRITSAPAAGEGAPVEGRTRGQPRPCAKCGGVLVPRRGEDGVIADACPDCRGVWLDAHELKRVLGDALRVETAVALAAHDEGPASLDRVQGDCPRCRTRLEGRRVQGPRFDFHVEQCATCQGLWFDENELAHFMADDLAAVIRATGQLDLVGEGERSTGSAGPDPHRPAGARR